MQKGPNDQLDEIENLLVKWIEKKQDNQAVEALVALTCARDSFDTIIRTVHVLVNLKGGHSQFTLPKICLFLSPTPSSLHTLIMNLLMPKLTYAKLPPLKSITMFGV